MTTRRKLVWTFKVLLPAMLAAATIGLSAQGRQTPPAPQRPTPPRPTPQQPTPQQPPTQGAVFRATANFHSSYVIVRDSQGRFVPDLSMNDFRVLEDGVEQEVGVFKVIIGGREFGSLAPPPLAPVREGLILPRTRARTDISGRIFIIFIDDLHLTPDISPRVKELLDDIGKNLLHDGDTIAIVSTGYSSIEIDPTYDLKRVNEARDKVMGAGMKPDEIISMPETGDGIALLRHNVHVAFSTAYSLLDQLAAVTDKRKAFIYISSGYHLNPFKDARLKYVMDQYGISDEPKNNDDGSGNNNNNNPLGDLSDPSNPFSQKRSQFSEADLIREIAELTRAAVRSNVSFYTIDPRGLIAGPSIDTNAQLTAAEWRDWVMETTSTLRVLAEQTGGFAVVETNDIKSKLREIDNAVSDYYILGYNSSNPDPLKKLRQVKIEVKRSGITLTYPTSYTLKRSAK